MRDARALLSLHDVTPAHGSRIERAWRCFERWGVPVPPALLVVPDHHGRWPLARHPAFVAWLRERAAQGCAILLHGYHHRADELPSPRRPGPWLRARWLTDGEGEFLALPRAGAADRLRRGRSALADGLGRSPQGFVAPAWLESRGTVQALQALGFAFHEDHLYVRDLHNGRRHFVPAVTFTGRSAPRATASVGWSRIVERLLPLPFDLRFALHPADFDHDELIDAAGRLFRAISAARRWVTYDELLAAA